MADPDMQAYLAQGSRCQGWVMVATDHPAPARRRETAALVADCVRAGCHLTHDTVDAIRARLQAVSYCRCRQRDVSSQQQVLF